MAADDATRRSSDDTTMLDDDAPTPRTPWRRWGLSVLVALPIAATFGVVVMLLGRALFLDPAREANLAAILDDMPPAMLLWLLAAATSLVGIVFVAREILESRAARRTGKPPAGIGREARPDRRTWAVPVLLAGSPVLSIALAAAFATISSLFSSDEESGQMAVLFATLAGMWLLLLFAVGWIALMAPREDAREQHFEEGIERSWAQQAAFRAFWDVMLVAGAAAFVNAMTGDRLSAGTALIGVILLAQADFALRVWLLKRREERAVRETA